MINKLIPVEGIPGLARDPSSKALINTNMNGYLEYVNSAKKLKEKNEKLNEVAEQVISLKQEMTEIKQMLTLLLSQSKA